ncbi:MAG: methionine adenosyltransferase [Bacteroidales bacterium]|nr:methionine adenosyltransferase [Bacteroidales bacterium]
MSYLFTSESVSEGHPDKVADQISDAVLDDFLRQDASAHVACETFVTTGLVVLGGEATSCNAYVDLQDVARRVIRRIGYNKSEYKFDADSCAVISTIHDQSGDIARGVNREAEIEQGAGDQGIMFGYACNETAQYMPLPIVLSHIALKELADIRRENPSPMPYLRPDAKSQFTVEYSNDGTPLKVHTIVISTQHDEFGEDEVMLARIKEDVENILLKRVRARLSAENSALFDKGYNLLVNPTGKFVIGGPHGDTGLTGRKIIVDTYGGRGAHGGGAFSGKDPSKVDRSATYAARYIAKNMVAAGVADEILVQLSYAIGVAEPVSIFVNTHGTSHTSKTDSELAELIGRNFGLKPAQIIKKFGLRNPVYEPTASYGHFGRDPYTQEVELIRDGKTVIEPLRFFAWEDLDSVEMCKKVFF